MIFLLGTLSLRRVCTLAYAKKREKRCREEKKKRGKEREKRGVLLVHYGTYGAGHARATRAPKNASARLDSALAKRPKVRIKKAASRCGEAQGGFAALLKPCEDVVMRRVTVM